MHKICLNIQVCFIVVQSLTQVWLIATPWTAEHQASLSFTISQSLLKLMSIESVMPSNHLILCHPLLLLPSIFPSIKVFSNESALCIRWPKCWSFSFSIRPSNEYSGLISFRTDWFDLLAVQGTLQSLLQYHNLKAFLIWVESNRDSCGELHDYLCFLKSPELAGAGLDALMRFRASFRHPVNIPAAPHHPSLPQAGEVWHHG